MTYAPIHYLAYAFLAGLAAVLVPALLRIIRKPRRLIMRVDAPLHEVLYDKIWREWPSDDRHRAMLELLRAHAEDAQDMVLAATDPHKLAEAKGALAQATHTLADYLRHSSEKPN